MSGLVAGQAFDPRAAELALTYQEIVRDLAAREPLVEVMTDVDASVIGCALCKERGGESGDSYNPEHSEACPWLRARALFPAPRTEEDRDG